MLKGLQDKKEEVKRTGGEDEQDDRLDMLELAERSLRESIGRDESFKKSQMENMNKVDPFEHVR